MDKLSVILSKAASTAEKVMSKHVGKKRDWEQYVLQDPNDQTVQALAMSTYRGRRVACILTVYLADNYRVTYMMLVDTSIKIENPEEMCDELDKICKDTEQQLRVEHGVGEVTQ